MGGVLVSGEWLPMEDAPTDGTVIMGLFGDEPRAVCWAEERHCMLAESYPGTPGIGLFGPGWEQAQDGLYCDEPDAWRPVREDEKEPWMEGHL